MYWDIVDQLYWSPKYLGMKSIPQKYWQVSGDKVAVPKSMTNPKGPLYRRDKSTADFWPYIQRQEEPFNHIFELVFSIMPGDALAEIYGHFIDAGQVRDYEAHGRELTTRIGYKWLDNITTTDGFYTSKDSILAVELKFNAKTSLDQIAKYVMAITAEQMVSGIRQNLNLLYIFPTKPDESFAAQTGLGRFDINEELLSKLASAPENKSIRLFYEKHSKEISKTLRHLEITCIAWTDLLQALTSYSEQLGDTTGDQTLKRLIGGLVDEILVHPLSNVT